MKHLTNTQRQSLLSASLALLGLVSAGSIQAQTPFAIPAEWAYPLTVKPANGRGFQVRVHQATSSAGTLPNSSARAEGQLAELLLDPATGLPYANLIDTTTYVFGADGSYNEPAIIDYEQSGTSVTGGSSTGGYIPGIPGTESGTDNIALEALTWAELTPGTYTMTVNSDDGFRVYAGPFAADKAKAVVIGEYEGGRGATDSDFSFTVTQAGLYSFRLLYYEGNGGANVAWYLFPGTDTANRIFLNDTANGGVASYSSVTSGAPAYFLALAPQPGATGVSVGAKVSGTIVDGTTAAVDPSTVEVYFDGAKVNAAVVKTGTKTTLSYDPPGLLDSESTHTVKLVYSAGTPAVVNTAEYTFTTSASGNLTLPEPIALETFDTIAEGQLPTGWTAINYSAGDSGVEDLDDPNSDSYKGWVVISRDRVASMGAAGKWDAARRLFTPELFVNSVLVPSLAITNFAYAESDQRGGSQVQYLFSPDYNLSGKSSIYLSYHSIYEQNQDNIAAVEYSIDEGKTWLPVVYMIDETDIIRTEAGDIDAVKTLEEPRTDTAVYQDPDTGEDKGGFYGAFIGAPIAANLAPYISGRINDDTQESKRIELFRLPQADNQAKVRLRFMQAGTASWYFGVDNIGFYSITQVEKPTIGSQPADTSVVVGQKTTLSVVASGLDLSYQWLKGTTTLDSRTNATLELSNATADLAGTYSVVVSNAGGSVTSREATVTVIPSLPDNTVLKQALWTYLPFDGNYTDASGSGNDAAAAGTPTFAAGKVGTGSLGVVTDSENSVFNYATLGTKIPLDATTDFSVGFWVKKNSSSGDPSLIANKDWDSGSNAGFVVFVDGAAVRLNYRTKDVARRDLQGPNVLGTPEWHHVVTTFKRDGDAVIYVDGNPAASIAIGPVGTTFAEEGTVLNIGQDGVGDYSPALNAEFDEVAIWGRVLSLQEVAAVYQSGAKGESFLAVSTTPTLSFTTNAAGEMVITYTGVLQSATALSGTFAPVAGATSPYTVKPSDGPVASFFRSSN